MHIQTLESAIEIMLDHITPVCQTENKKIEEAIGYILAEDIISNMTQPPFDRSPLDGYAMKAKDLAGAGKNNPVSLKVIDKIMAGFVSEKTVECGTAIRLMTGAPIPAGADCVVRQENTDYGENTVLVYEELKSGDNICGAGEDFKTGQVLMEKGDRIDSSMVAVLASAGVDHVLVYQRPKVALYTSGDELMMPGQALLPGKIYNSNSFILDGRMKEWNVEVKEKAFIPDSPKEMANAIKKVAGDVDLIITTGGVSVGEKDIMHEVCTLLDAKRLFWRVSIKPGAPTLAFVYGQTLIIALSGNPFGAAVNLEALVCPILSKIAMDDAILPMIITAIADDNYEKCGGVRRFVRANYKNGKVMIPKAKQKSGILSSLRGNNCFVDIPKECEEIKKGDMVTVWIPKK